MISANIILDNQIWKRKIKTPSIFFYKIIKAFPIKYQFNGKKVNLTVLLSENKHIKKLNKKFRNKDKPTDILSFPFNKRLKSNKIFYLGDIIISYQYMNKKKSLTIIEFKKRLIKIFIHGFLHLLNYDHKKLKDFKVMKKEELRIYNLVSKKIDQII